MTNKKRIKFLKCSFLTLIAIGLLLIHFFVPRLISEIRNPVVGLIKRNKNVKVELAENNSNSLKRKELSIKSFDGIRISARLTYSSLDSTKTTIILLHGIRSSKEHFIDLSSLLSKNGFNSVALDLRAHGKSEGQFCTFGVNEKKDIQYVIDYLSEKENINHIGIWGQSLGGAVALQAMGYDKRIEFGIIESTFTDFKIIVNDYFDLHAGFSFSPFSNYLANRAGSIAEFNANDAKPIKYCETINQPILIVHGNNDKRINIKYGKANFSKIKSSKKEFVEIKSANHLNVWQVGGEEYFNKVLKFINNQNNIQLKI
ncbi:alpha/beta fold hydrolase [Winogradskyella sp.]|uniref:alpha/beta hydrolase n=1 Tax=Winogradskyella sp. TaxID=1883156 RepID=UPI0025DB87E2|nr:alpha/beta fold hydrolase [Winogradskyella sp.]